MTRVVIGGGAAAPSNESLRVVNYGVNTSTARPVGVPNGAVYWIGTGTALPVNAMSADLVFLP